MSEVATDAGALEIGFVGGPGRARVLVVEYDMAVDEIADRLDPPPASRRIAEKVPGDLAQLVGFYVAAAHQIEQRLVRQIRDGNLRGGWQDGIGPVADFDDAVIRDGEVAGGRQEPPAAVAEHVRIEPGLDGRVRGERRFRPD